MLSIESLRCYCRTCLVKLETSIEDGDSKKFAITKYTDMEQLIKVCLATSTAESGDDDSLHLYTPYVCRSCFDKWQDFLKLYQLAIKNDETIRKVLQKTKHRPEIENNCKEFANDKNFNEFFIQTEPSINICEVEKYETTSPFYSDILRKSSACDVPANEIVSMLEDPTLQSNKEENNTPAILAAIDKSDEDISSVEDFNDLEFHQPEVPKKSVKRKSKKLTTKCNKKSLCKLRKKYRTRKSLIASNAGEDEENITKPDEAKENSSKKVRYECEACKKYFWEKNKYDGHMKQVHEGVKRPYQCQQCGKSYNRYKSLLQHTREIHIEKSDQIYKCEECDKIFKTAVILKQHLTNKHSEQKEGVNSICDQCGFIAANQYSLSQHIKNKHTETDHIKCEQCPKIFKTNYSLKYHMLGSHNPMNIKPFKCSECEMGFTRRTLLNQHRRTHLKYTERIKCDFEGCEVRFVKRGDKTHHMRLVHLKVKQHICDFCGEAFGAMQTLRHHRFIHTGEKPYKCNICGQGFRQRTAMKTHRKTHFGKETEERHDIINNLPEINLSLVNNLN